MKTRQEDSFSNIATIVCPFPPINDTHFSIHSHSLRIFFSLICSLFKKSSVLSGPTEITQSLPSEIKPVPKESVIDTEIHLGCWFFFLSCFALFKAFYPWLKKVSPWYYWFIQQIFNECLLCARHFLSVWNTEWMKQSLNLINFSTSVVIREWQ